MLSWITETAADIVIKFGRGGKYIPLTWLRPKL
jgi:hypothetical protein